MGKRKRQKLFRVFIIVCLYLLFYFLLISNGWTQERINKNVSTYLEALKDPAASARRNAAWALAHIGAEARAAVPALIEVLNDDGRNVYRAAEILEKIAISLQDSKATDKVNQLKAVRKALEEHSDP